MKLTHILRQLLEEQKKKEDRCKRIADRRYDKPSAYKSGAIVRCRQGKIWKDLKEEELTMCVEYKGGKCCLCGYNKCMGALDFHHIDPSKKDFAISKQRRTSPQKFDCVKSELDKCILVCSNCHSEIHAGLVQPERFELP